MLSLGIMILILIILIVVLFTIVVKTMKNKRQPGHKEHIMISIGRSVLIWVIYTLFLGVVGWKYLMNNRVFLVVYISISVFYFC